MSSAIAQSGTSVPVQTQTKSTTFQWTTIRGAIPTEDFKLEDLYDAETLRAYRAALLEMEKATIEKATI